MYGLCEMRGGWRERAEKAYFVVSARSKLVDSFEAWVMAVKNADALQLVEGDFAARVVWEALVALE